MVIKASYMHLQKTEFSDQSPLHPPPPLNINFILIRQFVLCATEPKKAEKIFHYMFPMKLLMERQCFFFRME